MRLRPLQIGALIALVPIGIILWLLKEKWWVTIVVVPVILLILNYYPKLSSIWKTIYALFLSVIVLVFAAYILNTARINIQNPPEWDMQAFWLDGRVGAERVNIYDYQNYVHEVEAAKLAPTSDFQVEKVNIAFSYPPPTIFLLAPLGWFSLQTAAIVWYGLNIVFLVLTILRLWQMFFKAQGRVGLLVVAALLLILASTQQTFLYAQTGFLLLFLLLSFWHEKKPIPAGIWLALAILIKPIAAIVIVYPLVRRQWRVILSMIACLAVLCGIFIVIYGLQTFLSYRVSPPLPSFVYTEITNQSLLATILRITHYDLTAHSPVTNPVFLGAALILFVITAGLIYLLPDQHRSWIIALVITFALLVYPASLSHYAVLLVPVMLLIWTERERLGFGQWSIVLFITIVYGIVGYNNGGIVTLAFILCWLVLAFIAYFQRKAVAQTPSQSQPA